MTEEEKHHFEGLFFNHKTEYKVPKLIISKLMSHIICEQYNNEFIVKPERGTLETKATFNKRDGDKDGFLTLEEFDVSK